MCNVARTEREEVGLWENESKINEGGKKGTNKDASKGTNTTQSSTKVRNNTQCGAVIVN